jgi:hypothetical protein
MPFLCGWWGWQRPTFQRAYQTADPGIYIDDPKIPNDFCPTGMIRRIHLSLIVLKASKFKRGRTKCCFDVALSPQINFMQTDKIRSPMPMYRATSIMPGAKQRTSSMLVISTETRNHVLKKLVASYLANSNEDVFPGHEPSSVCILRTLPGEVRV